MGLGKMGLGELGLGEMGQNRLTGLANYFQNSRICLPWTNVNKRIKLKWDL